MTDVVAVLMERGVGDEEREIERVEEEGTGSSVVGVAIIDVVRTGSGVLIIEEEVEFLKYRGEDLKGRH